MRRQTKAIVAISAFLLLTAVVGVNVAVGAAPSATIDAPSSVSYASAHLSGTVNPNGGPGSITVYAEYKPVAGGGWSYKSVQMIEGAEAEGTSPIPVEADITGLKPGTEYEVRFDAYSEGVETYSAEPNPTLTTLPVAAPTFSVDPATSITGNSAQLNATINPGNADPAFKVNYQFESSTDETNWSNVPGGDGSVPAGTSPVAVNTSLSNLEPNTTYYVRLQVRNAGGEYLSPEPNVSFTTLALAPALVTLPAATYAGGTKAMLGGFVNPNNSATTYWIEYGPTASYGTSAPLTQDAAVGSKGRPVGVSQLISGLSPETTYHFRIKASNSVDTVIGDDTTFETAPPAVPVQGNCPNEAIRREQDSTFLPSCRAWEKVTPQEKGQVDVGGVSYESKVRAAADGGAVAFASMGQFAGTLGGGFPSYYQGERGPNGWSVRATMPRSAAPAGWVEIVGSFVGRTTNLLWVDEDLQKSLIETAVPMVPEAKKDVPAVYLRDGLEGAYQLVTPPGPTYGQAFFGRLVENKNLAPVFMTASKDGRYVLFGSSWNFETEEPGNEEFLYEVDTKTGAMEIAGVLPGGEPLAGAKPGSFYNSMHNAISEDGSRLYFGPVGNGVYLRENGETVEVASNGYFYSATPDGSKALIAGEGLTPRIYDAETETTEQLPVDGPVQTVTTILAASENLDYVYMIAKPGPSVPDYENLPPNSYALYLWHNGTTRYLATLADSKDAAGHEISEDPTAYLPNLNAWTNNPYASWTPDGKAVIFSTSARVTGYDGGGYREVYRYDVHSDKVSCLSCPQGEATADAEILYPNQAQHAVGTHSRQLGMRRAISDDGKRAFFSTGDGLVAQDTNGIADVYVDEGQGPRLISSGTSNSESRFLAATASGDEVFIGTAARLTRSDQDGLVDIYSARVDGGFPEPAEPAAPCQGEACQAAATTPPRAAGVASNLVSGSGNQPVKRAGCTKPRKAKKHRATKHRATKKKHGAKASAKKRANCKRRAGK